MSSPLTSRLRFSRRWWTSGTLSFEGLLARLAAPVTCPPRVPRVSIFSDYSAVQTFKLSPKTLQMDISPEQTSLAAPANAGGLAFVLAAPTLFLLICSVLFLGFSFIFLFIIRSGCEISSCHLEN